MFELFNNREIATGILLIIFIVIFLFSKNIRESFGRVVRAFTKLSLMLFVLYMLVYISGIIYFFYYVKLWDISLLKDTVFWSFGGAFVMLINLDRVYDETGFFKNIFTDSLKLIVVLEFIITLYPFSLIWELILQVVILFIVLINTFSKYNEKDKQVYNLTNIMLSVIGLAYLSISLIKTIKNVDEFLSFDTLRSFLFGPILTIFYIPFIYFSALYMKYESFLKMKKYILNDHLYNYLKWEVLKRCNFNLKKINRINQELHIYSSIEKKQITDELNHILKYKL